ncbi:MAG: hypothetical protein JRI97_13240, partial [Deltaproteobacteria bacterium]|nr:hypothetical protein [Deltaproteobacteria bacterium]
PGEVAEIRAFGLSGRNKAWSGWARGVVYGYFDNADDFGRAALTLDQAGARGVYFVVNPCLPDLLARAHNKLKAWGDKDVMTQDKWIDLIRWVPVDFDCRHSHALQISSTDDEVKECVKVRNQVYKWLREQGVEHIVPAVSGNGAHLVFCMEDRPLKNREEPSQDETVKAVKGILEALAAKFSTDKVEIDTACFNPSRLWRLYGTTARKGDHTPERPHRRSYVEPRWLDSGDTASDGQPDNPTNPR